MRVLALRRYEARVSAGKLAVLFVAGAAAAVRKPVVRKLALSFCHALSRKASPESYSKSPKVADQASRTFEALQSRFVLLQVRKWCDLSGAHCDNPGSLRWTLLVSHEPTGPRCPAAVTGCFGVHSCQVC